MRLTAPRLAQLEERQFAEREVVGSNPGWTINQGEIILAVELCSDDHWVVTLSLVSLILVFKLEGDVKEPVTLFEKSRGCRINFCEYSSF